MNQGAILLVEDNPDDEALTMRALRKHHVANPVVVAHDGVEALAYLHGPAGSPAEQPLPLVVLLDLKLPKLNGLDVLQRIRANSRTRRLPVIVLTSSREERDLAESYDRGVNSFVCKPVEFDQFIAAIGALGLFWLAVNEPPPDLGPP